jgi:hypothetical protein
MPTLDWNKWASGWSAAFPKNQMWGAIRSGENDPETGEPLYRFNDKPTTQSMSPELGDVIQEHRFINPPVAENGQDEHCFCGWVGEHWGDHYQEKLAEFAGDHNAPREDENAEKTGKGRRPGGSGLEKDDKAHKATKRPSGSGQATEDPQPDEGADREPGPAKGSAKPKAATGDTKVVKDVEVKDEPKLDRE